MWGVCELIAYLIELNVLGWMVFLNVQRDVGECWDWLGLN
jgi:hypothetical protein